MDTTLDPTECRVVGVLIEKAMTTPDQYPLTLNALVNGCNQKNNRDPVAAYQDFEIEGVLRALYMKEWVTNTDIGGRTLRWKHRVEEQLGLEPREMAVLAELMLRGPQQPGELRARANRMSPIGDQASLMGVLEGLRSRALPLVVNHGRRSGERADRWGHTLGTEAPEAPAAPEAPTPEPVAPPPTTPAGPSPAPPASTADRADRIAALEDRVAALEAEVAALRDALGGDSAGVNAGGE